MKTPPLSRRRAIHGATTRPRTSRLSTLQASHQRATNPTHPATQIRGSVRVWRRERSSRCRNRHEPVRVPTTQRARAPGRHHGLQPTVSLPIRQQPVAQLVCCPVFPGTEPIPRRRARNPLRGRRGHADHRSAPPRCQASCPTKSPTRTVPPSTTRALRPPFPTKNFNTSRCVSFANKPQGSQRSKPSKMAEPTRNCLPRRSLSRTPRVTMFRRGIPGVRGRPVASVNASMFSSSISVTW
jgi:hypothetical protein